MMTAIDLQKLPYRRGVGLCIFNNQGLVLVAERRDRPGAWQMPQGGIHKDEDAAATALREMKEEVGTDNARIIGKLATPLRYDFPDWLQNRRMSKDATGTVVFRGKYRGQEQEWFALKFLGQDAEIDLSGEHEPELPEFIAWKWIELSAASALIVPFKKQVYDAVAHGFEPFAAQLRDGKEPPVWKG